MKLDQANEALVKAHNDCFVMGDLKQVRKDIMIALEALRVAKQYNAVE